jgi:hypothetical protein
MIVFFFFMRTIRVTALTMVVMRKSKCFSAVSVTCQMCVCVCRHRDPEIEQYEEKESNRCNKSDP